MIYDARLKKGNVKMNKVFYEIDNQECAEIRELFEKKLAYENLIKIISPNEYEEVYNRLISEYGKVVDLFNKWWNKIFVKYKCIPGNYTVDFDSTIIVKEE